MTETPEFKAATRSALEARAGITLLRQGRYLAAADKFHLAEYWAGKAREHRNRARGEQKGKDGE